MQFLVTVSIGKHPGVPPTALQTAMTKFVEDGTRAGTFVLTGGLAPPADGTSVRASKAGFVTEDVQIAIHGFAVVECPALEKASEIALRLLRFHHELVPEWEVACDVRPIVTHCLP